jgi:hypothetical protein
MTEPHALPPVSLDYQKPSSAPWRPVRMALGFYFLASGIDLLFPGVLAVVMTGNLNRIGGPGPFGFLFGYGSFFTYLVAGVFHLVACVGFLTGGRWRGRTAIVAQSGTVFRYSIQIAWSISYLSSRSRVLTNPYQIFVSYLSPLLIPLAMLYFIIIFNHYDRRAE